MNHTEHPTSISLVLPAWNECEVIERAISEADLALRQVASDYEIIVVDDGSTDGTDQLVQKVASSNPNVRLVRHDPNQGYGAALRSGFAAADKELVVFTDADCQFDLTELDRFVLLSRRYDVVCGYRIDRKDTALRCLYSKVYNLLVRVLLRTGVRDVDCAMKMFHRDTVKHLKITGNGFLVNSEILTQARRHGCSIVEVGVSHRARVDGMSTVSIRHIPKVLTSLARYWWNDVQFPRSPHESMPQTDARSPQLSKRERRFDAFARHTGGTGGLQVGLLIIAAIFLLSNLNYPLIDRDETRYAEIPREMLATGNWILPQLNFETYYDKPPLLYWLTAISFQLFGITEWAARLVPALAAWGTLASTMWFGTRHFGSRIGLLSGIVLMLSVGFAFTSRYLILDGLFSLLVTSSLFTAYESIRGDRVNWFWWVLSAGLCGLAFLAKGPLALVLWLPPIVVFTWLSEGYAQPKWRHFWVLGSVVAVIVAPWLVAVTMQDDQFLLEFFYRHHVRRFAGEYHVQPFWYFIPVLLIAGHPWTFLTIPYATFLLGDSQAKNFRRPPLLGFLCLWSGWCFAFFSISLCKLPTYLLPAAPAFALMIGQYLDQVLDDSSASSPHWFARHWSASGATLATCLAGIGFVVFVVITRTDLSTTSMLWGVLWTTLLASTVAFARRAKRDQLAWASTVAVGFLLSVMVMHQFVPAYSRAQSLFGPQSPLNLVMKKELDAQIPIATIAHEFSGVPFYLHRSDIENIDRVDDHQIERFVTLHKHSVLVVESRVTSDELAKHLPQHSRARTLGRRGQAQVFEVTRDETVNQIAEGPTPEVKR
ncbi:Undecaprenyl phosphate-alpha-4-amino-4-deoxy-L-arabinose arabinosyl transferase [Rubripirellula amarantea]|uniref:Undecaprenyl phosphate-alpha-4-amino-4-deoxy-L-arabinose arabinosyl transferase n=1 Tax=Rubripirellula amarantea TaxID=2527999 RepID=A0A5C5WHE1_9BACT|nr:glycosyltransferase [Rubripirellula amarantea]TWT50224.1 Undecaprenyl phosphate-alpha-4-amino-4-deoxy-L-arabinose arabinosyl transferase [Rubripirellula amarantea]